MASLSRQRFSLENMKASSLKSWAGLRVTKFWPPAISTNSSPVQGSPVAMMKAGRPAMNHQQAKGSGVVEKAAAKVESEGAEKERGTANETSRSQYQTSCFCNHDVPRAG